MLATYLFRNPATWIIPLLIQILSYWKILGKMDKRKWCALIPIFGEMEMSTDLFLYMRSFWRPAMIAIAMFLTSRYLGTDNMYSIVMGLVALIVYGVFLIRLYARLAKQFGKSKMFAFGLIMVPLVFLPILGFGKSAYLGKPDLKPAIELSPGAQRFRRVIAVCISVLELVVLVVGCFFITMMVHPFRPVAQYLLDDTMNKLSSVTDSDEIVGREETLGGDYAAVVEAQRTRD